MKNSPVISIIIPTFNRATLISESLDSIINQSFKDWECIIVDDHSTDETVKVIEMYLALDKRFKLFKRPNSKIKGANSCRNFGREMSSGKYIHWFDSDDIAHPKYLELSYELIKKGDYDFCRFSRSVFWGSFHYNFAEIPNKMEERKVSSRDIEALLKNKLVFNTCNVLWKKTSLKDEFFNENIVYADEWEYYSRLLSRKLKGISVNVELFFGRKHPASTTYEFAQNDSIRKASKIKAVKLVINNLRNTNLLSPSLNKFFIRLGFQLQDYEIIQETLTANGSRKIQKLKYKLGYTFYPIIKPFFKLKAKVKNG